MLVVDTYSNDPFFNLATEEYVFRNFNEEILFLYINSPSVVIGKHQNAYEEINLEYVMQNKLPVIRRISGGGTVYHDGGNLNFTTIRNRAPGKQINFTEQTKPVISFLEQHGLTPYLGDKNEIRVEGFKFSGNAEHVFKNRVLHHGTILFLSELGKLGGALEKGSGVYRSRAVQSNRTNVGNLSPMLGSIADTVGLKTALTNHFSHVEGVAEPYTLRPSDIDAINTLVKEKYSTERWTFGYGPDYSFSNSFTWNRKIINIEIEVKRGIITACRIEGDKLWNMQADRLVGVPHLYDQVSDLLENHFQGLSQSVIYSFFN